MFDIQRFTLQKTVLRTSQLIDVKSVTLHRVRIPLREPFRISNGAVSEKEAILVEVETTDGTVGWGEASPMSGSFYSDDTPENALEALRGVFVPRLFESKSIDPVTFYKGLREIPGQAFAKAGIEGALWDAYALSSGLPLCKLFGTAPRPVPSGVAIGIFESIEELLARVKLYVGQGYQRVKIKIQPGWDIEPVSAVRERFPDVPLMVDANAAYTTADREMFVELDKFGLMMIEQPLARDAHDEAGELQRLLQTPLCADESAESLDAVLSLIEKKAARIINIKVQRVGGLSEALLMLELALKAGLKCWVGTMPELGIASAQGLHFASHTSFLLPTDIESSLRWYEDDVVDPLINIDDNGFIHLPSGAGIGFKVAREKVERYRVGVEKFN